MWIWIDIKLGQFIQQQKKEKIDVELKNFKNRTAGLDEILPEVRKTRKFDGILVRYCKAVYNYRNIILTSIVAKIYNALQRNLIEPEIENIFRKNKNGFRKNHSTTSQILIILRILEGVRLKNLEATILFVDFSKAFDSIHKEKMEQILPANCLPKETVAAVMMLNKNTKVKVSSPEGNIYFFDIVASVLQRQTIALYLFIMWLDYVLQTSVDLIKENR